MPLALLVHGDAAPSETGYLEYGGICSYVARPHAAGRRNEA
jgi:hypothetical protein